MLRRICKCFFPTTVFCVLSLFHPSLAKAQHITGLSIPVNSMDAFCHPKDDNVWSVSATAPNTLNINSGIGFIINPTVTAGNYNDFSLHDHAYLSSNIPDPARAVVTYTFDTPTVVSSVEIIQHTNGISRIEGFFGNSVSNLTSLGSVFGPSGDVTGGSRFGEGQSQVFNFGNTTQAGTVFQFIVRKTSLDNGWASYRAFPLDINGARFAPVPAPSALEAFLIGAVPGAAMLLRRRRKA